MLSTIWDPISPVMPFVPLTFGSASASVTTSNMSPSLARMFILVPKLPVSSSASKSVSRWDQQDKVEDREAGVAITAGEGGMITFDQAIKGGQQIQFIQCVNVVIAK